MPNPLPLAIAELRRHLVGAIAIVLLIAVAVAFAIAISAGERALREASARAADRFDIIIGAPGSSAQLVLTTVYLQAAAMPLLADDVLPRLQLDKGIEYAAPIAVGDYVGDFPVIGTSRDFVTDGTRIRLAEGRNFTARDEAVIGSNVSLSVDTYFQLTHGNIAAPSIDEHKHGFKFSVVGRLPKSGTAWDNAILVPIEAIWGIHTGASMAQHNDQHSVADQSATRSTANPATHYETSPPTLGPPWKADEIKGVPAIVVRVKSPADAYRLREQYQFRSNSIRTDSTQRTEINASTRSSTMAVFPAEVLVEIYAVMGDMRKVMTALSLATQAVVLWAVLLVIIAALSTRRQSIAVLRAMGAPASFIFILVWLQSFTLIGLGAALGLVFGWGGSIMLVNIFARETGFSITPTITSTEWFLAATVLVTGSVLAIIPSMIAWRQNIVKTLR